MAPTVLHLRSETKPLEHRSALTPTTAKALIENGYVVNVERSPERIFDDTEFEAIGATLVPEGSWVDVPKEHIIVGLKELEEKDCKYHPQWGASYIPADFYSPSQACPCPIRPLLYVSLPLETYLASSDMMDR